MTLPRWTAYAALGLLALLFIIAVPRRAEPRGRYPRVVVLGIDGLDPEILREVIERYPERMRNFARLAREGDGIRTLATSTPPQSPVAWSSFITGRNPGGHGIFDFLHRDPATYEPLVGTLTPSRAGAVNLPGPWRFPTVEGGDPNRSGEPFWAILRRHGIPADLWRMPINFPVEPSAGLSFSGMMTPAVDSAYGEPTLYTTDPPPERIADEKVVQVTVSRGVARTHLLGPHNDFRDDRRRARIPLVVYVDHEAGAAALEVAGTTIVLEPGEWSEFVPVTFPLLPLGLSDVAGIVRFYLRGIAPELELYASPINIDPRRPIQPISRPKRASADLADAIGTYYTQGMAEDVNGLKKQLLSDQEFMQQAGLVLRERRRMLDVALSRYTSRGEGGLLFFYVSTVDLCCHMMWRHGDPAHPFHDAELAALDSSPWSGRPGSTWSEVVHDLYLAMDPILGEIRSRVGEEALIVVMSDHGFAPFRRKFSLNTWLLENGYLVLKEGRERELPAGDPALVKENIFDTPGREGVVDWSRTRAYGMGFNGLYLNLAGREGRGIVTAQEAPALLAELKAALEGFADPADGARVVRTADLASDAYHGERVADAPDIVVGYDVGYGNSDEASFGRVTHGVLVDNDRPGTFNGSHLMDPRVVPGMLLTNARLALEDPRLEDLTVEILAQYGIEPDELMDGRRVFE